MSKSEHTFFRHQNLVFQKLCNYKKLSILAQIFCLASGRPSLQQIVKPPLPDLLAGGKFFPVNTFSDFSAVRHFNPPTPAPRSFHSPLLLNNPWEANNIAKNFLKLIWAKSTKPFVTRSYQNPSDAKLFNAPKGFH